VRDDSCAHMLPAGAYAHSLFLVFGARENDYYIYIQIAESSINK